MISTKKATSAKKASKTTATSRSAKTTKTTTKTTTKRASTTRGTSASKSKSSPKRTITRVTIKYDVGFPNQLYLRGEGPDLEWSWEEGVPLKNVAPDTWVWETRKSFGEASFKVLINDEHFEHGDNHQISQGASVEYTPTF